mmetsp:Transcript_43163/g.99475  ORF Transcript_43163/g.99475 Transcript_43163/m.99475 type:complete len:87 (+) Transcript_43163:826-1086(+)
MADGAALSTALVSVTLAFVVFSSCGVVAPAASALLTVSRMPLDGLLKTNSQNTTSLVWRNLEVNGAAAESDMCYITRALFLSYQMP